jgi:hypothetical protein
MNNRLKKIGDRIAKEHKYEFVSNEEINREKINELILKHVKSIPQEERNILTLYIENKIDCRVTKIEEKLDEILGLQKDQTKEIEKIKKVVGCNGD